MDRLKLTMPERLVADTETLEPNYAKYTAEPLERGFGTTLGNSLRRVLLSSIKGAAITAIQIDQVKHEYSTIPGILEDVVQIILNLKAIRFRLQEDDPMILELQASGSGELTAADIRSNSLVEIINPDQHVATLDKCQGIDMEIQVETGRGYSLAEEHRDPKKPIGWIPVDAKFSPVERVNFSVNETRVEDVTDFDQLNLEIWTDGSITPKLAITQAAEILRSQLDIFTEFDETYVEPVPEIDEAKILRNRYLSKPVADLELSVRAGNCLETANIKTIRELVVKDEKEMLEYKNFGKTSLNEIKDQLANMGLTLGMNLEDDNYIETEEEEKDET
ncbi:MAG: DNA-directed RNA polymerase subunit alpha [Candidatus Poribacteria bacterium]|nr:DNA-directed RNA polymerase subunit alpha [Candidatus Poribacteria bacterium]